MDFGDVVYWFDYDKLRSGKFLYRKYERSASILCAGKDDPEDMYIVDVERKLLSTDKQLLIEKHNKDRIAELEKNIIENKEWFEKRQLEYKNKLKELKGE